jgi:hypothetical protein
MPPVNAYYRNNAHERDLAAIADGPLQTCIAEQLTCKDRGLQPNEISVRLIRALGGGMLAPIELDIFAAPYEERVERQDEICLEVRRFVLANVTGLYDANVWLSLSELGHSVPSQG